MDYDDASYKLLEYTKIILMVYTYIYMVCTYLNK